MQVETAEGPLHLRPVPRSVPAHVAAAALASSRRPTTSPAPWPPGSPLSPRAALVSLPSDPSIGLLGEGSLTSPDTGRASYSGVGAGAGVGGRSRPLTSCGPELPSARLTADGSRSAWPSRPSTSNPAPQQPESRASSRGGALARVAASPDVPSPARAGGAGGFPGLSPGAGAAGGPGSPGLAMRTVSFRASASALPSGGGAGDSPGLSPGAGGAGGPASPGLAMRTVSFRVSASALPSGGLDGGAVVAAARRGGLLPAAGMGEGASAPASPARGGTASGVIAPGSPLRPQPPASAAQRAAGAFLAVALAGGCASGSPLRGRGAARDTPPGPSSSGGSLIRGYTGGGALDFRALDAMPRLGLEGPRLRDRGGEAGSSGGGAQPAASGAATAAARGAAEGGAKQLDAAAALRRAMLMAPAGMGNQYKATPPPPRDGGG